MAMMQTTDLRMRYLFISLSLLLSSIRSGTSAMTMHPARASAKVRSAFLPSQNAARLHPIRASVSPPRAQKSVKAASSERNCDATDAITTDALPPVPPASTAACLPYPVISRPDATSRVLCIYTGGTLGMVKNGEGGSWSAPGPKNKRGGLSGLINSMPEFQDDSMPDIDMVEFDPLLDSSNVGPSEWCELATLVGEYYFDYDGFVIIHGTDTISYTASALSFMLEGLGKAVVLTGSIIPMCEPFNDARRNLIASIMFASQLELSEVAVFFNDRLLRGNRAVKVDSHSLAAIDSPNFPPLATAGAGGISTPNRHLWRAPPICRLRVHTNLEARVVVLRLTPGFDDSAISCLTQAPDLRALVLSLYGTGNGPSHKAAFMETIAKAVERDLLVVAVTQCHRGSVQLSTYEVGQRLMQIGVVAGGDMTTEACVTKIAYLCGRGLKGKRLRDAMATNLRGELTLAEAEENVALNRDLRL